MDKSKRAQRRYHTVRLKENRKNYWAGKFKLFPTEIGKVVQYPAVCSCHMCGNPRKYSGNSSSGKTRAELSFLELIKNNLI